MGETCYYSILSPQLPLPYLLLYLSLHCSLPAFPLTAPYLTFTCLPLTCPFRNYPFSLLTGMLGVFCTNAYECTPYLPHTRLPLTGPLPSSYLSSPPHNFPLPSPYLSLFLFDRDAGCVLHERLRVYVSRIPAH